MSYRQDLHELIEPAVQAVDLELLGLEMIGQGKHSVLRIFIDSPEGITVDNCADASRQISALLDVEDPITGEYNLEVSSPGLERPLFKAEHFTQAEGLEARVAMQTPVNGQRKFRGVIKSVQDDRILLQIEDEQVKLPIADLAKAHLIAQLTNVGKNDGK
jgi:ribosome maturation factor RimP